MVPAGNPFVAGRCQNIENNAMQSSRQWPAFDQQLDTSGNSGIYFYYSELMQMSRHGLLSSPRASTATAVSRSTPVTDTYGGQGRHTMGRRPILLPARRASSF